MKVVSDGKFDVCVYSNEKTQRHHLPHCHVYSPDGDVVVALPSLKVIVGKRLSKRALALLEENLEAIWEAWIDLNGE
jgi:hypothetical protein